MTDDHPVIVAELSQDDANPVGRPLEDKTRANLDVAIEAYSSDCVPHIVERMVESGVDQNGNTILLKRKVM